MNLFKRAKKLPVPGTKVTFHVLSEHTCGGKACQCEVDWRLPATVVAVANEDDEALILDVQFPDEQIATREHEMLDHNGETIYVDVTHGGFISRQSYARPALLDPPESGSWTL